MLDQSPILASEMLKQPRNDLDGLIAHSLLVNMFIHIQDSLTNSLIRSPIT